jgi:hypothetical protein
MLLEKGLNNPAGFVLPIRKNVADNWEMLGNLEEEIAF